MAGGVKKVDAKAVVFKLKHRGGDRNTSLLLYLHPVGNGMLIALLALDGARLFNRTAVKKKLLGQGGFTCVGVRDDGEGAPSFNFGSEICHVVFFSCFLYGFCAAGRFFRIFGGKYKLFADRAADI